MPGCEMDGEGAAHRVPQNEHVPATGLQVHKRTFRGADPVMGRHTFQVFRGRSVTRQGGAGNLEPAA
jgi:hypothetical protein